MSAAFWTPVSSSWMRLRCQSTTGATLSSWSGWDLPWWEYRAWVLINCVTTVIAMGKRPQVSYLHFFKDQNAVSPYLLDLRCTYRTNKSMFDQTLKEIGWNIQSNVLILRLCCCLDASRFWVSTGFCFPLAWWVFSGSPAPVSYQYIKLLNCTRSRRTNGFRQVRWDFHHMLNKHIITFQIRLVPFVLAQHKQNWT